MLFIGLSLLDNSYCVVSQPTFNVTVPFFTFTFTQLSISSNLQATLNKEINYLGIINKSLPSSLALSILNNRILQR
jgi:hypothetical protein